VSRDWNIVDDSEDESTAPEPQTDDSHLDTDRIRRIARERRANDRLRFWRAGFVVAALLAAVIVLVRAKAWLGL
jgi:hypothetical protein